MSLTEHKLWLNNKVSDTSSGEPLVFILRVNLQIFEIILVNYCVIVMVFKVTFNNMSAIIFLYIYIGGGKPDSVNLYFLWPHQIQMFKVSFSQHLVTVNFFYISIFCSVLSVLRVSCSSCYLLNVYMCQL